MNSQIISTTLSIANQTAVPSSVRKMLDLKPGDKLLWEMETERKLIKIKPAPKKWGKYMRGLGKNIWIDTDTDKYIKDLRRDRKLQ